MKIIITESMEKKLIEYLLKETINGYSDKVLSVKKYLDTHWLKADTVGVGNFDECATQHIVMAKSSNGEPLKQDGETVNKTLEELFELLQAKYKNLFGSNTQERDKFLKQIIKDWFNNKITSNGVLTKY